MVAYDDTRRTLPIRRVDTRSDRAEVAVATPTSANRESELAREGVMWVTLADGPVRIMWAVRRGPPVAQLGRVGISRASRLEGASILEWQENGT